MTKICAKCGRELDESNFGKRKASIDGLQGWCKDCKKKYMKERYENNHQPCSPGGTIIKNSGANSELAKFTPRELMAELKARGYSGELSYLYTIKI